MKILTDTALPFLKKSFEIASKREVLYTKREDVYVFSVIYPKDRESLVEKIEKVSLSIFRNIKIEKCSEDMLN